jgi:hypothetical protein
MLQETIHNTFVKPNIVIFKTMYDTKAGASNALVGFISISKPSGNECSNRREKPGISNKRPCDAQS